MSFGKAFDEAFKPANAAAVAGTLDLIKEKIKLDAAKAEEASNIATTKARIADLSANLPPEMQAMVATQLDPAVKHTKESIKNIGDLVSTTIQDRVKAAQAIQTQQQSYAMRSGALQPTQPDQMAAWKEQQGKFLQETNMVNDMKNINPGADINVPTKQPALMGGQPYSPVPGFETPAQAKAGDIKSQAKDILQGIKEGTQPADLTGLGRTAGLVGEIRSQASKTGVNLTKLSLDYLSQKTAAKNMNSTQQLRMRQALSSVRTGIPALRELSSQLDRTDFVPANNLIIGARLHGIELNTKGLTPSQVKIATKYITQINLNRDELAQGFMGGGTPTETAFQMTDDILNLGYGKGQMSAALDQLDTNLNQRDRAIAETPPLYLNGGNQQQTNQLPSFGSEAEARKAGHKSGDRVTIGGQSGTLN